MLLSWWFLVAARIIRSYSNARLLERAAGFLAEHAGHSESVILGSTRAAAHELALAAFPNGCQGVHALTLTQLAAQLAAQRMGKAGLAPISRLGIEALAARVVHSANQAEKLRYFGPVAQTPGFPRAAARTIAELRLAGIPAEDLAARGAGGADLAELMNRYERELEERSLADLATLLRLAAEEVSSGAHRLVALPLIFFDITLESRSQANLVRALSGKAPAVFACAVSGNDDLARALGMEAENLDSTPAVKTLERVRTWLFSTGQPPEAPADPELLFSAPGESLECVEIARRIRALAERIPFDRIAILLRNVEQYQPLVEEALRRAAIPAYFSRGTARPDPAGRAFLALLACAGDGCSASRFAEYLSLGQLPLVDESGAPIEGKVQWAPPDDEILANFPAMPPGTGTEDREPDAGDESPLEAPIGWEKLLVDAAVIGGHGRWARRLRGLRAEFEAQLRNLDKEDQSHRPHIERRILQLERLEHFSLPLIDELGAFPKSAHWGEWLEVFSKLARIALRRPETVLAVLSELEPMSEVGPATLDEVYDVLSEKLGLLRTEPARRRYGQVFVGAIEEGRGRVFDAVFLPGLAEGLFPKRALEDPLLLDLDRAALRAKTEAKLVVQDDRVARERMLLRFAAAAAADRFVVSYPRMDVTQARPRVPSFYALEVLRAAEGRLPSLREFEKRAARSAPARLDWPAPEDPGIAIDDAEYDLASLQAALKKPRAALKGQARYLMETNECLARSLRTRARRWRNFWSSADGIVDPEKATLKVLESHRFSERSYSPSSLQQFASCPYRFLLQGVFRFRPREEPVPLEQMDPLTRGALFHEVQFELFRALKRERLLPITQAELAAVLDIADRVLDRVAEKREDDLAPAIPRVWKAEMEELRTDLRGWIKQVAASAEEWTPVHFEFGFGLPLEESHDASSTREEVRILDGIRLRGSIDLVEKHATRNVLRVVDHKTGKAPANRPQYVGGGAILQPLLYALAAEQLLRKPVESGGLFFCTQRGDFSQFHIPLDAQARERLTRVLEMIGHFLEEGFLPAAPQTGACAICDYRPVCGPYEEQRAKKKRPDRLEELIAIRNLP